jgi:glyoxylase-like metal-dependent hydrolase (beta-lactamase superfamily II)
VVGLAGLRLLAPHIWWQEVPSRTLPPYRGTACYWLVKNNRAWLVDAGDGDEPGRLALEEGWTVLGRPRLEAILITHWHLDHSGGAGYAAARFGAPVYLHGHDAATVTAHLPTAPPWRDPGQLPPGPGGLVVRALNAPGHTAGQVNLWLPDAGVLLAGDNVLGLGTSLVVPPDGHLRTYEATLRRLQDLGPTMIGPGHGPPLADGGAVLAGYLAHRRDRERQVLDRLAEAPATAHELALYVYRGEAPETVALGRMMLGAHLDALADEGRVVQHDGRYRLVR